MEIKYFGESICSAIIKKTNNPCEKKAYYISKGKLFCGTHSRMLEREVLPKNPNETQMKNDANNKIKLDADEQAKRNRELGRTGTIKLYRMLMFGDPIVEKGYYNIFPNFKHGPRKDGKGLPMLSPKSIGPIDHGQPGLPMALNLENFHQANKVFPSEVENGDPTPEWYETQLKMYKDPIPHRHKASAVGEGTKKNVPLYSIWRNETGNHKISYIESRQFYCTFYQKAVQEMNEYKDLLEMLKNGYHLQICGYDAFPISWDESFQNSWEESYKDSSKPFGHERVLTCMLIYDMNGIADYPWIKFKSADMW